jgi:hypothetical protein
VFLHLGILSNILTITKVIHSWVTRCPGFLSIVLVYVCCFDKIINNTPLIPWFRAGGVAQWHSACLTWAGLWVWSPEPQKKKKKKEKEKGLDDYSYGHSFYYQYLKNIFRD